MPAAKGQVKNVATPIPDLYASAPERLPFAPSLEIRTFLLRRERGNLLLYSSRGLGAAAAVLDSSDRALYIESLELLRELDFDLLVPWAASGDQPFYAHTDEDDARRRIDAILGRVRAGQDH